MTVPHTGHSPGDGSPARTAGLRIVPLTERTGVRVSGEICRTTQGIWEQALQRAAHQDVDRYHLELSAVTFVDVTGATALAVTAQQLGAGRRLVLDRPPPTMCRLLELFWPGLPTIEVAAR